MDLPEFKTKYIKEFLGINDDFGIIYAFVDFANVNHWFDDDELDAEGASLAAEERLSIDLRTLKDFLRNFSQDVRFYYGHDPLNSGSASFMGAAKYIYGKHRVFTKPIQKIKHYLEPAELASISGQINVDPSGSYIIIPKSNFDVEITIDAIRMASQAKYDTFCLLSSDSDFASLLRFLKNKSINKKTILIKGGYIQEELRKAADLVISAQNIKQYITVKKQRPGSKEPGLAES